MSTEKRGTWARLAAQPGPNPLWAHPLALYLWLGIAGWWASNSGLHWLQVLLGGLVLAPLGLLGGRVLVRQAAKESPEGQEARRWSGYAAAGLLVLNACWSAYAAGTNVASPLDLTAFGVLAALLLPIALAYANVRALLLEHHDQLQAERPALTSGRVAQQVMEELAPTIATAEAREWTEIVSGSDLLGNPRVTGWKNTWCGFDVTVELDPDRDDTAASVSTKLAKITGRAARVFKLRGISLREGGVRLIRDLDASADVVVFKVTTRDVLANDVPVEPVRNVSINRGIQPVRREDGELAVIDIRDEHGVVSGASRSGKSTYEMYVWREILSTKAEDNPALNDGLVWVAGGAKLPDLVGPFLRPLADGRAIRPVLDYVSDPSWEETKRWLRVLATVVHIRSNAPLGVFQRDRNKIVPLASQPLIWSALEEADEVLKNGEPIDLPFATQKKTAGQIIQYIASKGLSSRVILELMLQGTTESMMGPYAGSIKQNCLRRAVFRTELKAHGSWLLPNGSDVDSSRLRHKSMLLSAEGIDHVVAAKAPYLDEETVVPQLAVDLQHRVTTMEDYTQQKLIELLGDEYASRWSLARTAGWREYFASIGTFPSLEDATPPEVRDAVRTGSPRDTTTGTVPEGTPRPPGAEGEKDGVKGRWYGAFFVPGTFAASGTPGTGTPASADGDLSPEWQATLEGIRGLDTVEPVRPSRHPVPEPLATIVGALVGDTREFVSNQDLAALSGTDDTLGLGKKLSEQGVPARKKGDSRGRLVAELRAAAEAWRRGEQPSVSDE